MSENERPGVYSSYEVTSALYGSGVGRAVGVAAVASGGVKGAITAFSGYGEAAALYGPSSNLAKLIRVLLENGAPMVYAVPVTVSGKAVQDDYALAFSALMSEGDIGYMVCDSGESMVHQLLRDTIQSGDEQSKYRIGVVETAGTAQTLCDVAEELNSERMVLVGNTVTDGTPGMVAAAVTGVIAAGTDPAVPLNGAKLQGISGLSASFTDGEITTLIQGGVTPVENTGREISVVRGVTTRTKTGNVTDKTWRDLNTILIVDDVLPTVRNSLHTHFARTKNTAQTRGAIRTQVIIELENKKNREIIEDYDNVIVTADPEDPTVCQVNFAFTVAHGLSRIQLMAHITV